MIDDSFLLHLKGIGMSEYEAKVFLILSALRVASAREIHEQTKIPRGKTYETLNSLVQKGFIVPSGKSPVRYSPVNVSLMFEQLKRKSMQSIEDLYQRLRALESDGPKAFTQGHMLCSEWTRDTQIRMMIRRAKTEIILICNDDDCISRYRMDIVQAAKKVYFYLVLGSNGLADNPPVKCYVGGNDIEKSFFQKKEGEKGGVSLRMLLLADRQESLSVLEEDGRLIGIVTSPDMYAEYLSLKIIREIQPAEKVRKNT